MGEVLAPQPGPQTQFLSSQADLVIYGGAAGGGKSYALLLEPTRHLDNPDFSTVIFRRTSPQLTNPGGLWDEAAKMYPQIGGKEAKSTMEYHWEDGMKVVFRHMEHEKNKLDWQGGQIPLIMFDEITHFTESQVMYMMSRNRSGSGVSGYMRGTCNPDCESWVRTWVDWYIGEDGLPILERSGVIRWFIRIGDDMLWANTREELIDKYQQHPVTDENRILPKSFTFIPATIYDNKELLKKDPGYLASLNALPRVEREALLGGNWNVKPEAGSYYQRAWVERNTVTHVHPSSTIVRFWDRAATEPNEVNPNPDWTVGLKMARQPEGIHPKYVIMHVDRDRKGPAGVRSMILEKAERDGKRVRVGVEQEPGSSGKADADHITGMLTDQGYDARARRPSGNKRERYMPFSAECENGNVGIMRGAWNEAFHTENENCVFDDKTKDDQCDAASGALEELSNYLVICDFNIDTGFGTQQNYWQGN